MVVRLEEGISRYQDRGKGRRWVGTGQRNVRRVDYCQQDRAQRSAACVYGGDDDTRWIQSGCDGGASDGGLFADKE